MANLSRSSHAATVSRRHTRPRPARVLRRNRRLRPPGGGKMPPPTGDGKRRARLTSPNFPSGKCWQPGIVPGPPTRWKIDLGGEADFIGGRCGRCPTGPVLRPALTRAASPAQAWRRASGPFFSRAQRKVTVWHPGGPRGQEVLSFRSVKRLASDLTVPLLGPRMVRTKRGTIVADVRPN
jgi:hypothetical protein